MVGLAIAVSVIVTCLMFVFYQIPELRKSMILSVNISEYEQTAQVLDIVKKYDAHYSEKSRNMVKGRVDMLLEIRLKDYEPMLQELNAMESVQSVSLIAHKGEVTC